MIEQEYCYGCERSVDHCICKYAGLGEEAEAWPRDIWAFQIDHSAHEMNGVYVSSEHATVPRWEGDTERDRPVKRYVDADIFESERKYHKHQRDALQADVERLRDALDGLEKAATIAIRIGAQTGAHWTKLTSANLQARAALKGGA